MTTSTTPAPFSPGPVVITSNNGPDVVTEQLVTKRAYATFINDAPIGTSFTVQIQATNGGIATKAIPAEMKGISSPYSSVKRVWNMGVNFFPFCVL